MIAPLHQSYHSQLQELEVPLHQSTKPTCTLTNYMSLSYHSTTPPTLPQPNAGAWVYHSTTHATLPQPTTGACYQNHRSTPMPTDYHSTSPTPTNYKNLCYHHSANPTTANYRNLCYHTTSVHLRVSEIGCPGARDTCLTPADKYLPHQLSTGHTLQMICCCCSSKICWWWATSICGGQVKLEILVAQGQPHHFWISKTQTPFQ
jgi:hypothetical protein